MAEVLQVIREEFPETDLAVEGMQVLEAKDACFDARYIPDVVYLTRGRRELHLQIIIPYESSEPLPLIIHIPGSAFMTQDVKRSVPNLSRLAAKGYAVALLEYRGSEEAMFPSVILDAKAGILFMKEHASEYNIDPERITIMGDSSGGYTALMAGLTYQTETLEDSFSKGKDYRVRSIVEYYAPTDFTTMFEYPSIMDHIDENSPEGLFLGNAAVTVGSDIVQKTIIKKYLSEKNKDIPLIMFHGNADELVPFAQSCELYEALKENGNDVTFYQVKGAHHGGAEFWSDAVLDLVDEFVKSH